MHDEPHPAPEVPISDSYWVIPGRLLAGEYPGSFDGPRARARLDAFVHAGIRTFIDLTATSDPLPSYEPVLTAIASEHQLDLRYYRFPVQDGRVPTGENMTQVLARIRAEIDGGRPTYVHCWGGIGRTGTAVGCWLVEEGRTPAAALQEIERLRGRVPDRHLRSPENDGQCDFVRTWRPAGSD